MELLKEFWDSEFEYVDREIAKKLVKGNTSHILLGPRRAGKSTLLYNIADLLSKKVGRDSILYLNFEDPLLIGFSHKNFKEILEAYNLLVPNKRPILLLDEIQSVEHNERFLRSLVDKGYRVFVTGSNSKLLKENLKHRLGGRFIFSYIYPLNFEEFLKFKNIKNPLTLRKVKILRLFNEFLKFGGFPEVVLNENKKEILTSYFELNLSDIRNENKAFSMFELEVLVKKIRENIGKPTTVNSYKEFFNSINYNIDKNKLYLYFNAMMDNFFLVKVEKYTSSVLKRSYEKKFYFIDNGYISLLDVKEDLGLKLENLVALELIKRNVKVYYWKGKHECDFIVSTKKGREAIQVSYQLDGNRKREIEGLLEAMRFFDLKKGLILTYDEEDELKVEGRKIVIMPVWKWLLNFSAKR